MGEAFEETDNLDDLHDSQATRHTPFHTIISV